MARSTFRTSARKNDFPSWVPLELAHLLGRPLRQQGEFIGSLNRACTEVRPFTPAEIKLLETFADQAVIAIENVRLFKELKESLEQQTATSEILGVIASSPTDIQPVWIPLPRTPRGLCDATDAVIFRVDGNMLRPVAHYGPIPWAGGEETDAYQSWIGRWSRGCRPANNSHSRYGSRV